MKRLCFVQLGRYGDILNLLPLMGFCAAAFEVHVVTDEQYCSIYDGTSYVTPHPFDHSHEFLNAAIDYAKTMFSDEEIVVSQVFANEHTRRAENFCLAQWKNVSPDFVKLYHQLPLEFDLRCLPREERLAQEHVGDAPNIAYNLCGISSPFGPDKEKFEKGLKQLLADEYHLINLGDIAAHRIYDLLGIYQNCKAVISVDTSTLHLTHATQTPTIALTGNDAWHQSEQRSHWLGKWTYDQAVERLPEIVNIIKGEREAVQGM